MFYTVITNVRDVLLLCGLAIWINLSLNKKYSLYFLGVMFGLITMFVINGRIAIHGGRFYDFRHITITLAGFIGGPLTAGIAALMASVYRYYIGGNGSMGGIVCIIVFACFGTLLGKFVKGNQSGKRILFWFNVGILMAAVLLVIVLFYPSPGKAGYYLILKTITPLLILTPFATTILFNYYFYLNKIFRQASILNNIMTSSGLNLLVYNKQGAMLVSDNLERSSQYQHIINNPALLRRPNNLEPTITQDLYYEAAPDDLRHLVADLSCVQIPAVDEVYVAVLNDVTERQREHKNLNEANERFRKAFQLGPLMMGIMKKADYRFIDVNDSYLNERNFSREEVIGKTPAEIGVPEIEFRRFIKIIEANGCVRNLESSFVTKFGLVGTIVVNAELIQINNQDCILIAYSDITEMKRLQAERVEQLTNYLALEAELARSNQLIADIINNMSDGFFVVDHLWRLTFVNKKAEEFFYSSRNELLGKVMWKALPRAKGTSYEDYFYRASREGVPVTFEYLSYFQRDIWYQVIIYPSPLGLSVFYRDVTEQKLTREKLIKSKEELTGILESMTDCFFALDACYKFTYINHAGEIAFGRSRSQLLGKSLLEVFSFNDEAILNFRKVMEEKQSLNFEIISEAFGNKCYEIHAYPNNDFGEGLTCYFRDITRQKNAQEEMARLERLNLVGQLAAGIGHEIRNPMTTVRGYLQLLSVKPMYSDQKSTFELMISELDRANSIITEFLSLARLKQTELKLQNLNDLVWQLYPLLEADTFNQNKKIRFISGNIPDLNLNAKEITQMILNLARNGLEAMLERGCLTIESYLDEKGNVILSIEDEGRGIPPENNLKIGTPFFTTKDSGTGLGLATCYKIAESHHAKISFVSGSWGTIFKIVFPIPVRELKTDLSIV